MAVDKKLLEILACPKCKGGLKHIETKKEESLICEKCRLKYRVDEDIPIMLIDEATPI